MRRRNESKYEEQRKNLGNRWILICVTAMCGLGTTVAVVFRDRGEWWGSAAGAGALVGLGLFVLAAEAYGVATRCVWRRRRGYPFAVGDRVQFTSGDEKGRAGRVRSIAQGQMYFDVVVDNETADRRPQWISAGRLSKIKLGCDSGS